MFHKIEHWLLELNIFRFSKPPIGLYKQQLFFIININNISIISVFNFVEHDVIFS